MKLNQSYKNYKLNPKRDYFMGCPTMLNSEKAALAKVTEIWNKLEKKGSRKFLDTDFGPID